MEAYLAEYNQLRTEIATRTSALPTLITVELATLGAGLSVSIKVPDVTLALALVATFLWLVWLDQANQVRKIAAYLSIELAPRVRAEAPGAFGWEAFLRRLEQGGEAARDALKLPSDVEYHSRYADVGRSTTILFGVAPAALIVAYVIAIIVQQPSQLVLRFVAAGVMALGWLASWLMYFRVMRAIAISTEAILHADTVERDGEEEPCTSAPQLGGAGATGSAEPPAG